MNEIKPVENLNGLSPIEDWIHHSQWLEQERDKVLNEAQAVREMLSDLHAADCWLARDGECSICDRINSLSFAASGASTAVPNSEKAVG